MKKGKNTEDLGIKSEHRNRVVSKNQKLAYVLLQAERNGFCHTKNLGYKSLMALRKAVTTESRLTEKEFTVEELKNGVYKIEYIPAYV